MINQMIDDALRLLAADKPSEALKILIEAKRHRIPTRDLDYTRAMCFVQLSRLTDAREACKEELRYFPDHKDAGDLLAQILEEEKGANAVSLGDDEFRAVLEVIRPYTMLSVERLFSLFTLAKRVCQSNVPGNFVECGVAAGGSSALLAYVIAKYSQQPRWLYSFDTFEGMPTPGSEDTHQGLGAEATGWGSGTCAAPLESLQDVCSKLGVWELVRPVKGLFQETLPVKRDWLGMIALLHLDGDWYDSTKAILENLYDRVSNGGVFQVDDYGYWEGCRRAVHEFEQARGVKFSPAVIDGTGVWFEKPESFRMNSSVSASEYAEFKECDPVKFGLTSQMSVNERFQLHTALRGLLPPRSSPFRFVEVGSFAGASLFQVYLTLKRAGAQVQGFAVEPGGQPAFYQIMRQISAEVAHLKMFSHPASLDLKSYFEKDGNWPQFILIDGDHSFEGVRQDMLDYYPLLAPGGVIVFHDYLPPLDDANREAIHFHHAGTEPGIRRACHEVMEGQFGLKPLELPIVFPDDLAQTQAHLPIIPEVLSSIRAYRKPA